MGLGLGVSECSFAIAGSRDVGRSRGADFAVYIGPEIVGGPARSALAGTHPFGHGGHACHGRSDQRDGGVVAGFVLGCCSAFGRHIGPDRSGTGL